MNGDCGGTVHFTTFYVPKQSVLLNFSDKLRENDVAGARQSAILDKNAALADDSDLVVRKEERLSSG